MPRPLTNEDGEVRELSLAEVEAMRPASAVHPELVASMSALRNRGGRPRSAAPKTLISFRIDAELIARIKATGRGYNARVEKALKAAFDEGASSKPTSAKARAAK
jgi:uncharacterized protein (DUF4415 family)